MKEYTYDLADNIIIEIGAWSCNFPLFQLAIVGYFLYTPMNACHCVSLLLSPFQLSEVDLFRTKGAEDTV